MTERKYAVCDTTLQGFTLRVQPNGARSWVFRFRRDANEVRRRIRRAALATLEAIHGRGSTYYLNTTIQLRENYRVRPELVLVPENDTAGAGVKVRTIKKATSASTRGLPVNRVYATEV